MENRQRSGSADAGAPRISAVIITCDEAAVIDACLRSVAGWVDEIVVVDMHSTDGTREIVRCYTERVIDHERLDYGDPARGFALLQASGDWIIMLDPDERVPGRLAGELRRLAVADEIDVAIIPRRALVFGAPLEASGYQHDTQPRFFRAGVLDWPPRVHDRPVIKHLRRIELPRQDGLCLEHEMWRDAASVVSMLSRYTPHEVENFRRADQAYSAGAALHATWHAFFATFIKREGYRDGQRGLWVALIHALYQIISYLYLWEASGYPEGAGAAATEWGRLHRVLGVIDRIHALIARRHRGSFARPRQAETRRAPAKAGARATAR